MSKVVKAETLKSYLLGKISKEEAENVDLQLISNENFEDDMIVAEDFLIEDYLEGELSKKEIALFHTNFLISEERKQQVKTIAQLKRYSESLDFDGYSNEDAPEEEPNIFQKFINTFTRLPVRAFAGLLIVGMIGVIAWAFYTNSSEGLSSLEREYAQINNEKFSNLSDYEEKYSNLILLKGNTRSAGKSNALQKDDLTEKVFFDLAVKADTNSNETFRIELLNDDVIIFTLENINPIKNGVGEELRFFLPNKVLERGKYKISVQSNSNEDNKLTYPFEIK